MMNIGNISRSIIGGRPEFVIDLFNEDTGSGVFIKLVGIWDRSTVVNELIRSKYPQDRVEAIINNHFLNISDWLDKKFNGENVKFEDAEYEAFQKWRNDVKNHYADMVIEAIENYDGSL